MSTIAQPRAVKAFSWMRQGINYVVLLLVGFLLGVGAMWIQSRENAGRLSQVERQLTLVGMQNTLASAVIDARRGDYEPARQAASSFFTALRAESGKVDGSAFSQAQKAGVLPLYTRQDEIITLLARSDPASADRLSDVYVSYRQIATLSKGGE